MKTAIVIGATGLIGKHLTKMLLENPEYKTVKVFVRRSINITNPKLEEFIVNFDEIVNWKDKITGAELYSSMGTTIKKAGSKQAQYKIDFTYQYEIAKAAAENGVENYCLVSSSGANQSSKVFYLRIKGEIEERVKTLSFKRIRIFQPSLLIGEREEKRFGEKFSESLMKIFLPLFPPLKKYRPIKGEIVARAMINSLNDKKPDSLKIYRLDEIFKLV